MKQLGAILFTAILMLVISNYFFEYVISRPMDGNLQMLLFAVFGAIVILLITIIIKQLIKFFKL